MLQYIPTYERKSAIFIEIFDAELNQFKQLESNLEDIKRQLNPDTATWGLSILEKELGIKTPNNNSIELRRANVKSKLKSSGKADSVLIRTAARVYSTGNVDVFFQDGVIYVHLFGEYASHIMSNDLINLLESIIPAHLPIIIRFCISMRLDKYMVGATMAGEEITVYPWQTTLVEAKAVYSQGTTSQTVETLTVYPQ